jgi:hypothetical protein
VIISTLSTTNLHADFVSANQQSCFERHLLLSWNAVGSDGYPTSLEFACSILAGTVGFYSAAPQKSRYQKLRHLRETLFEFLGFSSESIAALSVAEFRFVFSSKSRIIKFEAWLSRQGPGPDLASSIITMEEVLVLEANQQLKGSGRCSYPSLPQPSCLFSGTHGLSKA